MPQISPMKWYLLTSMMAMNFLIVASQLSLNISGKYIAPKNIKLLKSFNLMW